MTPAFIVGAALLMSPVGPPTGPSATKEESPFEVTGRVLARETFAPTRPGAIQGEPWSGGFSLASARLGVTYRVDDIRVEMEAELAEKPRLVDAFARLDTGWGTGIRVGQFKVPFSAVEGESSWKLPTAERGVLHDLLQELQVAGRRPGAQLEWASEGSVPIGVEGGVWQGSGFDGEPRDDTSSETVRETVAARIHAGPKRANVGISGAWRVAQPAGNLPFERFWAAGADASIETGFGLRLWADAITGASWIDEDPADGNETVFGYGQVISGWRVGGDQRGAVYLEPFLSAGVLDPGVEIRDDLVVEVAGGVNVGRWKRWRTQLQLQDAQSSRNTPAALRTGEVDRQRAVLLQVGVSL